MQKFWNNILNSSSFGSNKIDGRFFEDLRDRYVWDWLQIYAEHGTLSKNKCARMVIRVNNNLRLHDYLR